MNAKNSAKLISMYVRKSHHGAGLFADFASWNVRGWTASQAVYSVCHSAFRFSKLP